MLKKIILASILGGLAAFLWGFLSWNVFSWHMTTMKSIRNESAVVTQLTEEIATTGVYMFPGIPRDQNPVAQNAYGEKIRRGPIGYIFYTYPGVDPMPQDFLLGFLLFCLSAFIASTMLSLASETIRSYSTRVFFVTLLGIFTALSSHLHSWNWLHYPTEYSITNALDVIATWLIAGLVIAAIIKPKITRRPDGSTG